MDASVQKALEVKAEKDGSCQKAVDIKPEQHLNKYTKYCPEAKAEILNIARTGRDWKMVARKFNVNVKTAYRWVSDDRTGISAKRGTWGGKRFEKVTQAHMLFLREQLSRNADLTLNRMTELLMSQFGIRVSPQTIKNRLDKWNYQCAMDHVDDSTIKATHTTLQSSVLSSQIVPSCRAE
uniref:Uncharacterized protein AlNc14C36G3211 n=1 Tax=Albugo laibachii Nc14 TaxID=890382 RepID=F0W8T7_9STRA|nr:conserved hypothetical protein [Albugo laibachii Nc14]|eukprot:CCA17546.1 conserved hypothetical protein [Albugo laibachii Nc14]